MAALYLKKFKLKEEYRDIPPFSVTFRPGLNVIVGENGSGKSTLFELLMDQKSKVSTVQIEPVEYRYFNTEKHNPRTQTDLDSSPNIGYMLHSRFRSHGEALFPLMEASKDFKKILLFVDEPEAGLSLKNQAKVLQSFTTAVEQDCQILLATHSYIIINSVPEVFSMDDRAWISSKTYWISSKTYLKRT